MKTLSTQSGFTLVEILVSTAMSMFVMAAVFSITLTCMSAWHDGDVHMRTIHASSMTMEWMVYGEGTNGGLREASGGYVDSSSDAWTLVYTNAKDSVCSIVYDGSSNTISFFPGGRILSDDVVAAPAPVIDADGVSMEITVAKNFGKFSSSNTVSTFVKFRNMGVE